MEEICDGVKILCERMENNPEDFEETEYDPSTMHRRLGRFYYDGRNIEALVRGDEEANGVFWHLRQQERDALIASYTTMVRNAFTRRIVEKLLADPEPEADVAKAVRKVNRPLTKAQMVNESLQLMNKSFDEAYAKNHTADSLIYKATGRYEIPNPWDKK